MIEPGASLSPSGSTAASPADPKAGQAAGAVPRISACVITLNEADRIEACLRSLAFCDEIILVDSGSSDATQQLARANGARVFQNPFAGYRSQKEFAVGLARNDWVLCIDADERVSERLRASIEAARAGGFKDAAAYKFARANEYFGVVLRHGNAHPDRVLRLFDRRSGAWRGYEIHESVKTEGPVLRLAGELEHNPYRSFSDQLQRNSRYAQMMAANMHAAGRRAHLHNLVLNPFWRFLRGYVLRLGFLDGWRGLVYAFVRAQYVQQKFIGLWLLQHRQRL